MNKEIWLAGGCFWGVEEYFSRIDGVVDTSEKQKEPSPLLADILERIEKVR